MTHTKSRLLLLGGTTESLALAEQLAQKPAEHPGLTVITSLAGRTVAHRLPPGEIRVGGFGGAAGLAAYLESAAIDLVVDATHPFAATISRNAALACNSAGVPRLQLLRPAWERVTGDLWHGVPNIDAAAKALPAAGQTVFLAVGRQELARFAGSPGLRLIARMIDPPDDNRADNSGANRCGSFSDFEIILARGPFGEADEEALFKSAHVDMIVSKNSGGDATYAKIAAARRLGIPVLMIDRPAPEPGDNAATVDAALAWISAQLSLATANTAASQPRNLTAR